MLKVAVFKINHCCLCPQNEMRLDNGQEFWCKLLERKLDEDEYSYFPIDCPKPEAKTIINPEDLRDLEYYLNERII